MSARIGWGVLLLCVACRSSEQPPQERAPEPLNAAAPAPAEPEQPLDAHGRLLPSGRFLDWLELPRGFRELKVGRPQLHVFAAEGVTVEQTRAYLSERMLTGHAEELGKAVFYRAVLPLSAAADATGFDVNIAPRDGGRGVTLSLESHVSKDAPTLSLPEVRKLLADEQTRAE